MLTFERNVLADRLKVVSYSQACAFGLTCAQRVIVPQWLDQPGPAVSLLEDTVVEFWTRLQSRSEVIDRKLGLSLVRSIEEVCQELEEDWVAAAVCNVFVELIGRSLGEVDTVGEVAYRTYDLADAFAQEDLAMEVGDDLYVIGDPVDGLRNVSEMQIAATPRVQLELSKQHRDLDEIERWSPTLLGRLMERRHQDRQDFYRNVDPELLRWIRHSTL